MLTREGSLRFASEKGLGILAGISLHSFECCAACLFARDLFQLARYIPCVFVVPKGDEPRVPQMIIGGPLTEFKLPDQYGLEPAAVLHFDGRRPLPHRPLRFSGRLAKGQSGVSSTRNFCISCARDQGVNPLRVRAT